MGRGRSPPRSRWSLGSRPCGPARRPGIQHPRRRLQERPVSRTVPSSPLQEANLCSCVFLRCALRLSCNIPPLGGQCLTPPAPLAGGGRLFAVGGASPRRPLGLGLRPGTLGGREQGRGRGTRRPGGLGTGLPALPPRQPAASGSRASRRREVENRGCPGGVTAQWENRLDPAHSTLIPLDQYCSGIRSSELKLHASPPHPPKQAAYEQLPLSN